MAGESGFLVKSISQSGALLETQTLVQNGSNLELSMHLPSGEIEAEGRMVESYHGYDESGSPCTRIAVEFQGMTAAAQDQIGRLVQAGEAA